MNKPTLRRNGRHMVTMTTKHHLGGYEIAVILVRFSSSGYGFSMGDQLTRTRLERSVRRIVNCHGDDAHEDPDWRQTFCDEDEYQAACAWAVAQVRRLMPEMDDTELASVLESY